MRSIRAIAGATLCIALIGPLLGAGAPPTAVVEALNREGLARFASGPVPTSFNSADGEFSAGDFAVSPLLLWLKQEIRASQTPPPERALLYRLEAHGVAITANEPDAFLGEADHLRQLGVTYTTVGPPPTPRPGSTSVFVLPRGLDVTIATDDPVDKAMPLRGGQVPFWSHDGVRAMRFDTKDGGRSVFVFLGERATLDALRSSLWPERWAALNSGFTPTLIEMSDAGIDSVATSSHLRATYDDYEVNRLVVMRDRVAVHVEEHGARTGGLMIRDWTIPPRPEKIVTALPFLYAVVDNDTGVILLLGEHG
ncbi:MAG TPA: hypothetical protein VMD91_08035 [Candidatus Sulfotelmatobacter sp.]|nr:hypothetical protein [Candidatus Sulfotelmatobacter sp.]